MAIEENMQWKKNISILFNDPTFFLKNEFKEGKLILGASNTLEDIFIANYFPHLDSAEKHKRQMEILELTILAAIDLAVMIEQSIARYNKEQKEKDEERIEASRKAERKTHEEYNQFYREMYENIKQQERLIAELLKIIDQLHEQVRLAYSSLADSVLRCFNNILDPANPKMEIPELGIKVELNAMLQYVGKSVSEKLVSGALQAKDLEKGIDDAVSEFFHAISNFLESLNEQEKNKYITHGGAWTRSRFNGNPEARDKMIDAQSVAIQKDLALSLHEQEVQRMQNELVKNQNRFHQKNMRSNEKIISIASLSKGKINIEPQRNINPEDEGIKPKMNINKNTENNNDTNDNRKKPEKLDQEKVLQQQSINFDENDAPVQSVSRPKL